MRERSRYVVLNGDRLSTTKLFNTHEEALEFAKCYFGNNKEVEYVEVGEVVNVNTKIYR